MLAFAFVCSDTVGALSRYIYIPNMVLNIQARLHNDSDTIILGQFSIHILASSRTSSILRILDVDIHVLKSRATASPRPARQLSMSTLTQPPPIRISIMSSDAPGDSSAMADSFTLPLRPLIEKCDRPDTLPVEIAQINAQWGSFRDVNEDELQAKIQEEKDKEGIEDEDEGETSAGEVDSTERLEQLYKRRAEITQFALYVLTYGSCGGWN